MARMRYLLVAAIFAAFATGCFDIEESIDLKKDMSGTANLKLGVDMEPMITIMAMVQRGMEGKKGPPTKEEIDAAKAEFKKNAKTTKSETPADPKKDMEKDLPPGVKLLDASVTEKEFGMVTNMKFAFDKLSHLVDIKMPQKGDSKGGPPDPTKTNVLDTPFQGLDVVETATTITIRTKPQNPAEKVKSETKESGGPPMDAETQKMMEDAFKGMRFAWKITAPFQVISSNAHRREGNTLIWEYDFKKLQALGDNPKAMDDMAVKVVYKK